MFFLNYIVLLLNLRKMSLLHIKFHYRRKIKIKHARRDEERESVRGACSVRDAPSLPAFKNTRRLKLSTLVLILYSAFLNFVSQPVVLWFSGNIILVKSMSLIITSFSPLLLIRMEKDILSFVRELLKKGT